MGGGEGGERYSVRTKNKNAHEQPNFVLPAKQILVLCVEHGRCGSSVKKIMGSEPILGPSPLAFLSITRVPAGGFCSGAPLFSDKHTVEALFQVVRSVVGNVRPRLICNGHTSSVAIAKARRWKRKEKNLVKIKWRMDIGYVR